MFYFQTQCYKLIYLKNNINISFPSIPNVESLLITSLELYYYGIIIIMLLESTQYPSFVGFHFIFVVAVY